MPQAGEVQVRQAEERAEEVLVVPGFGGHLRSFGTQRRHLLMSRPSLLEGPCLNVVSVVKSSVCFVKDR